MHPLGLVFSSVALRKRRKEENETNVHKGFFQYISLVPTFVTLTKVRDLSSPQKPLKRIKSTEIKTVTDVSSGMCVTFMLIFVSHEI